MPYDSWHPFFLKCMKYKLTLILLFFACSNALYAQVKGVIKDQHNQPLVGAFAQVKGTNIGTSTNFNGEYEIRGLKEGNYFIVYSYIGHLSDSVKIRITNPDTLIRINKTLSEISTMVDGVSVIGSIQRESEYAALKAEKNADHVINVVSARTIELSPDLTVANVAQRVSGVSLERSTQGDGRYAIIRGMDQRYNNTLVNGIKIPSPESRTRFIPLDIFPSELLQRMEVYKALTPDLEGDAIGGTINMIMKDAPAKREINFNISTGYTQFLITRDYYRWIRSDLGMDPAESFGNQYFPSTNDFKYGSMNYRPIQALPNVLMGGSFGQRFFKDKFGIIAGGTFQNTYRATEGQIFRTATNQDGDPVHIKAEERLYSIQQERLGLNVKLDYKFNEKHSISLYNVYMQMNDIQYRKIIDTSLTSNRTQPGTGGVTISERSRYQKQAIANSTLQGNHQLSKNGHFDWSLVYSYASQDIPDMSEVFRSFTIITPPGDESEARFDYIVREWRRNVDNDYATYLNYKHDVKLGRVKTEFKTGGMYRLKQRFNRMNDYRFNFIGQAPIYKDVESLDLNRISIYYNPANAIMGSNNYDADEQVGAAYIQTKIEYNRWNILAGVRNELTFQTFETQAPLSPTRANQAEINYADILPSIHFKYLLTKEKNLRLSYFKSISRPSYFELVPYEIIGENFTERGNSDLKHTVAHSVDFRYEHFPNNKDNFMAGAFYKYIINPIEYGFLDVFGTIIAPQNFGNATNYGIELVYIKYVGNWGVSSNYTLTQSEMVTNKVYNDNVTQTTYLREETRPLQGQSRHIGNVSLLHRNTVKEFNAQLSYVFTGRRITQISPLYGLDYYQRNLHLLDFSCEKSFKKKWVGFVKISNLLNAPFQVDVQRSLIVQREFYSQFYVAGIRVKMN
jgi:hypothetical protein